MRYVLWCCAWLAAGCHQSFSDVGADGGPDRGRDDGSPDTSDDPAVVLDFEQAGTPRVDIVVLVDNSGSMGSEQSALTQRFPELLVELMDPPLDPSTGRPTHPPVEDLNLAVISPDLGTAGYRVTTCSNPEVGDDGCFLHEPSPAVGGCATTYPSFLSRNPENAAVYPVLQLAQDFTCLATLGESGCGFEQPLAAMRAAVTTNAGPGGCNAGFLRPDSILALVFVSDEDDCSVRPDHGEMFDPDRTDLGHLNIRCFLHSEYVTTVDEFVAAFRALRGDPDRLVLSFIVGVPPDAPQCIGSGDALGACLEVPAMLEQIDPATPSQLIPSCNTSMGLAMPPRRFVRLAQAFGSQAIVDSVCKSTWTDAVRGLTDKLVEVVPGAEACLSRTVELASGRCTVDCALVETLSDDRACPSDLECPAAWCPATTEADVFAPPPCVNPLTGADCEPLKRDLGTVGGSGGRPRRQCLVRQAERTSVGGRCGAPASEGWYYLAAGESGLGCPTAVLAGTDRALVDTGSRAVIRCR